MTLPASDTKLFQPIQVGDIQLQHRVALAPLTRHRNTKEFVPSPPIIEEYYSQRASVPGTLLISEGIVIAAKAGGCNNLPGIWNIEQITAWKKITDAVHAKGSFIYAQLFAVGRVADPKVLTALDPSFRIVGPSDIPLTGYNGPVHPLTVEEIKEYVQLFSAAASNAVDKAGFDGVEIHFANGYLLDQFLQDTANKRTDEYGGSSENRARFPLEVVDAVVKTVGAQKTAVRVSPWSIFQDMRMEDPKPTFAYVAAKIKELYPNFAYLHAIEPRVCGGQILTTGDPEESNDFIRDIWFPKVLLSAGGFTRESALKRAEETGDIIVFGRSYIANPDLPFRLFSDLPLNAYDRPTFSLPGDASGKGYTDYPFSKEFLGLERGHSLAIKV